MKYDGMPKHSDEFKREQRNLLFRRELKKWRERGWSRYPSRIVARAKIFKPEVRD